MIKRLVLTAVLAAGMLLASAGGAIAGDKERVASPYTPNSENASESLVDPPRATQAQAPNSKLLSCTATVTNAPGGGGNASILNSEYLVWSDFWLQLSTGPGCTPYVRVVGNVYYDDGTGPVNGGFHGRPHLFQNGTLVTNNPYINVGSSGTDGVFSFYGNWFARQCGKLYKSGINVEDVSVAGNTYNVYTSWTAAGSYTAPAC